MEWYLLVWKRFAEFNGRSRRKEYWMFTLFNMLICLLLYIPGLVLVRVNPIGVVFVCIYFLYALAVMIPSLSCYVRRLHDRGKSGWWVFLNFVPLIGAIVVLVWLASDSVPGMNEYGPNPKYSEPFVLNG